MKTCPPSLLSLRWPELIENQLMGLLSDRVGPCSDHVGLRSDHEGLCSDHVDLCSDHVAITSKCCAQNVVATRIATQCYHGLKQAVKCVGFRSVTVST